MASLCACGASGVAGGSLLLIPLACNMFGISNDVAMQVVAVGFIIGVLTQRVLYQPLIFRLTHRSGKQHIG